MTGRLSPLRAPVATVVLSVVSFASLVSLPWADANAARTIGVAPFASEADAPDFGVLLARKLEALSSGRVIAPENLRVEVAALDAPRARDVRRWAEWNDVDELVVGRMRRGGREAVVELRSGHSGAPRAEYVVAPETGQAVDGAVGRLARRILADLGETSEPPAGALPPVAAAGPESPEPPSKVAAAEAEEPEDELALLPGASQDDPISINSDELEVLPQGGGRKLVFSRNVEVQQGEITLEADRLEAIYPEGASQPDRLHASGNVRVVQGDRRGRCEEATYERTENKIVCRGKAQVTQGCDEVRGESIEFDLARKRVRVVGAASVLIQPDDSEGCATPSGNGGDSRE